MPIVCPVCSKKYYKDYQNVVECTSCWGLVHHGNRLGCSGLTDAEYEEHRVDEHKPFQCDHCVAKAKGSVFLRSLFLSNVKTILLRNPGLSLGRMFHR